MTKHVAVVGAGLGGLRAAEQLRAAGHAGPLTVIGAEAHMPYNRPPLSKELLVHELLGAQTAPGAGTDRGDDLAALHERAAFRRRTSVADVTFRLGAAVTGADIGRGRLELANGDLVHCDGLVIATGLRPRRLHVPGPDGPGSGRHVVRTLDDCADLRADLRAALTAAGAFAAVSVTRAAKASPVAAAAALPPRLAGSDAVTAPGSPRPRVVVVGGGFLGCEIACTALAVGCDVTVVEPVGPPMLRVLGTELAQAIQRAHERAGIRFVIGQAVIGFTGLDRVSGVVLADGTDPAAARVAGGPLSGGRALVGAVLPADVVVEAVGSIPNVGWLAGSGLDLSDGVLCDNTLTAVTAGAVPGVPAVAVGDVARFPNPLFDDVPRRVEHWSMPTETARRAAATLRAKLDGGEVEPESFLPLPSFWSDQGELRLQAFGFPELADDAAIAEGDPGEPLSGLLANYLRGGRLVGNVAVNLPPVRYRELRAALSHQ